MALIKKGPNKWSIRVSVRVPGKDYPISKQEVFNGTKTEAELRRAEIIKSLLTPRSLILAQDVRTFNDAVTLYREKNDKFSPSHDRMIKFLERETGHLSIEEYPDRFESWLRVLKNTPTPKGKRSTASVNRYIAIVKAIFTKLVELGIIEKNSITKARFPKGEEKPRDRYLSDDERLRLINVIREHRPYILPFIA